METLAAPHNDLHRLGWARLRQSPGRIATRGRLALPTLSLVDSNEERRRWFGFNFISKFTTIGSSMDKDGRSATVERSEMSAAPAACVQVYGRHPPGRFLGRNPRSMPATSKQTNKYTTTTTTTTARAVSFLNRSSCLADTSNGGNSLQYILFVVVVVAETVGAGGGSHAATRVYVVH